MSENDNRPYEVGYGKPPVQHRFQPGRSGNPGGPKRKVVPSSVDEALDAAMMKKQPVTINGRRKYLTRAEIIAEQVTSRAASGDPAAIREVMRRERSRPRTAAATPEQTEGTRKVNVTLNIGDEEIQRKIEERLIEDGIKAAREKQECGEGEAD